MNASGEIRAAQSTLTLPEIVSLIMKWIYLDCKCAEFIFYPVNLRRPLLNCGLVNSCWFHQAMHYLWKQPLSGDLPKLLEKVTPQRRQFYANFVEEARMCVINDHRILHYDAILRSIRFPRLNCLYLSLESDHKESQDCECRIPRLESYQIKTLIFDYFCGMKDGLTPHEMDQVLEQIPATLPQVEEIHFDKEPEVNKGAFERLTQRLPGLKYIEHSDWFEFWGNMY